MRGFEITTPNGVVEIRAFRVSRDWLGWLRFHTQGGGILAEFRPRAYASWWETAARLTAEPDKQPDQDNQRPRPYTGAFEPLERPAGWNR